MEFTLPVEVQKPAQTQKEDNASGTQPCSGLLADMELLGNCIEEIKSKGISAFNPPVLNGEGEYEKFVNTHSLNSEERLLILLSLAQFIDPGFCKKLSDKENKFKLAAFPKWNTLLPTGETFLELISAGSHEERITAHTYFETDHLFYKKGVVILGQVDEGLTPYLGALKITPTYKDLFLYNRSLSPRFSSEFPAHCISTNLEWEDLIAPKSVLDKLYEVKETAMLMPDPQRDPRLAKHARKGYRCLLHGPSGVGKTLAASLLGKYLSREVYRVDLSAIVSKYVGETSKNLGALFNTAEDKNWILFFDEGDSIFGKRIDTSESSDKNTHYANQDVAYLLQRIENFNGLVIVATNLAKNLDGAFSRRFEMAIEYGVLEEEKYNKFWMDHLPKEIVESSWFNFKTIFPSQERMTPASIINICLRLNKLVKIKENFGPADFRVCVSDEERK